MASSATIAPAIFFPKGLIVFLYEVFASSPIFCIKGLVPFAYEVANSFLKTVPKKFFGIALPALPITIKLPSKSRPALAIPTFIAVCRSASPDSRTATLAACCLFKGILLKSAKLMPKFEIAFCVIISSAALPASCNKVLPPKLKTAPIICTDCVPKIFPQSSVVNQSSSNTLGCLKLAISVWYFWLCIISNVALLIASNFSFVFIAIASSTLLYFSGSPSLSINVILPVGTSFHEFMPSNSPSGSCIRFVPRVYCPPFNCSISLSKSWAFSPSCNIPKS